MAAERQYNLAENFPVNTSRVACRASAILTCYGLLNLLGHALWPSWLVLLPTLLCGFILSGFLNAAHDCVHLRHTGSKQIDRFLGIAWCTPILVNYTIYKAQHLVHHRHTGVDGDPEHDVEFKTLGDYLLEMVALKFWRSIFLRIARTFRDDFPDSIVTDKLKSFARTDDWIICAYLALLILLTFAFPVSMVISVWLPLLFYPTFAVALSLPEHYGLRVGSGMVAKSRNVGSNGLLRFFQWNANFHAAHHRAPNVPSIWLDRFFHQTTPTSNEEYQAGYLEFHRKILVELLRPRSLPPPRGSDHG